MKSILFLSIMNGDPWGGSEEQWFQLALWMVQHNLKADVAVFDWKAKREKLEVLEKYGSRIYWIPNDGKGIFKTWKQQAALNKIPFEEYDLVYVNQGGWKEVAHGPFKSLYKKLPAYVVSFHNYQLNSNLPASKISTLRAWIQKAALCIGATEMIFNMLRDEYAISVPHKEVSYSPPTFSPPGYPASYPQVDDRQPVIFLVLSALDIERKAQDVLIKAFQQDEWKHRNWQLHLYGEGKDRLLLESLIVNLKLESNIFLKGHTSDVKSSLASSHLLIQATHVDAMPISVIEAMAMARPCLVSSVGDMPAWVTAGYNGYIAARTDEESIREQLETAWQQRSSWQRMGLNAFETFQKKYPLPFEEKFLALLTHYYHNLKLPD